MPPKKKQQEIDLSTLPECISSNAIFLCKGKKQRSQKIITKILQDYKSLFSKISRQQVLDHAKQKNIYVDPNTLNDKQKKDPKFMQSICTELTPDVIAKATKSLIDQLNIKVRLQLKAQNDKPQQQRPKPIMQKKLDQIYLLNTQFCQSALQYQALSKIKQGVKYILVINPTISWTNAPEIPQPQQGQQQPQQQDQQIKQFKQLKSKQELKEQDIQHNHNVQTKINTIKQYRRQSKLDSQFRNCIIDVIDFQIDPYNEEQSLNELSKGFISRVSKLNVDYDQFMEWKKERTTIKIVENQIQQGEEAIVNEAKQSAKQKVQGATTSELLLNFVNNLFPSQEQQNQQSDDIQALINGFDFNYPIGNEKSSINIQPFRKDKKSAFSDQNENNIINPQHRSLQQQIRSKLQYPGINRFLMPDLPLKSAPLRKLNRSQYVQFLHQNLPYQQFQRRLSLIKFEQILKQTDQQRKYTLSDRVYEQYHDEKSLMRQVYRALANNQQAQLVTKYNEENDKLYLTLLYKNNQRRNHSKLWQSTWKVLPNYESWLKYFKENDNNYNTQLFYDIDYQKIGHINDQVNVFSIPDGGILINKKSTIANFTNQFLYGIKNHHLFGFNNNIFYSQNKNTQIYHFKTQNNQYQTEILIGQKTKLRLKQKTGDIVVQCQNQKRRIYTPDGYTIIYQDEKNNTINYKIFHPTGGITSPDGYINQRGLGLKNNNIHTIPALLRRSDNYQIIKRDDNTVIISDQSKKWIKFYQGTQYLIQSQNGSIQIQKKNLPFVKCDKNGSIQMQIDDLIITGTQNGDSFVFQVRYSDGNKLSIQNQTISITQLLSNIPYLANIETNEFTIQFGSQKLIASKNQSQYFKNGVIYNPTQNQQTFNENQTLPVDHLQPKLFIISPDNTGVEYLSQKQLQYYFNLKALDQKNNTLSTIPNSSHSQNVHIVSRIIQSQEKNPKRINLNFNIDLDIFKSEKYFKEKTLSERFTVRSLIKHRNLLPEDELEIEEIKDKRQEWYKRTRKQQNQFGHKPKGDPVVEQLKNDKKIMIDFRKKQLPRIDFQQLKNQAISEWKFKEKQHMTLVAQKQQEDKIRMRLSKKKKSIVQTYPPIVQKSKQIFSQAQNYSPAGCYTHYFQTDQGKKALAAMPEWVFRPKTAKQPKQLDPQILTQLNNTLNKTKKQQQEIQQQQKQRYDTVDVNLNPIRQIYIKPSVFTQRQIDQQRQAFQHQKKAYFYHQKKRKQFNLYGGQRKNKIQVKSLLRTQPISQINQKYLITQAPLDKKIKISSMKNKLTSHASSLVEMRKQGPHHTLLKTIDKRNDYNTLLEKRTMMVHADLNDKLQRDILITPVQAQFGYLKQGRSYELKINIKNQDILAQRLVVKKARNINVKVMMNQMGPIALGMSRKIIVQIKASSEFLGRFTDEFEIVSKHQIYKIPVTAHILSQSQFQNQNVPLRQNIRQIQQVLKRKMSGLPPIN